MKITPSLRQIHKETEWNISPVVEPTLLGQTFLHSTVDGGLCSFSGRFD